MRSAAFARAMVVAGTLAGALAGPWDAANARVCRPELPAPAQPLNAQFWRDAAEFAFLIGRDQVSDAASMVLARRFSALPGFSDLRRSASAWDELQSDLRAASGRLSTLSAVVPRLQRQCDILDAVSLSPEAAFDAQAWLAEMAALRGQIDDLVAGVQPVVASLNAFADLVHASAASYRQGSFSSIPDLRIGPDPQDLADGMRSLDLGWRAVLADLRNARAILPIMPDLGSERPLLALTAAATELARVAEQGVSLSAGSLDAAQTAHFLGGDYLYDACPMLRDGHWVTLESVYWTGRSGKPAMLGSDILLAPHAYLGRDGPAAALDAARSQYLWQFRSAGSLYDAIAQAAQGGRDREAAIGSGAPSARVWQFNRIGFGYWLIRNAAIDPGGSALDVVNDSARDYPLDITPTNGSAPRFTGQYWRCTATGRDGAIRLHNAFLSEARSLDTPGDVPVAIMPWTGLFSGQFWIVRPVTSP